MERTCASAVLLTLLPQLARQWTPVSDLADLSAQVVTLGVSAAPSAVFRAGSETVEVRGLAIGDKLFVHFVARDAALRLDLLLSEYAKLVESDEESLDSRTHTRVGPWLVSAELLQWRLERSIFPVFRGAEQRAHVATSAGAELGRLPESLLLRIAPFLTGREYCGMTQTNKFLHEYAELPELWEAYVEHEFPHVTPTPDEPPTKALFKKLVEREARRVAAIRHVWESLPPPPPHIPVIDPFTGPLPSFVPRPDPILFRPREPRPPFFDDIL